MDRDVISFKHSDGQVIWKNDQLEAVFYQLPSQSALLNFFLCDLSTLKSHLYIYIRVHSVLKAYLFNNICLTHKLYINHNAQTQLALKPLIHSCIIVPQQLDKTVILS